MTREERLFVEIVTEFADEFGWVKDEFIVWIQDDYYTSFKANLVSLCGRDAFSDGSVEVTLLDDCFAVDLNSLCLDVDIEDIYPRKEFEH